MNGIALVQTQACRLRFWAYCMPCAALMHQQQAGVELSSDAVLSCLVTAEQLPSAAAEVPPDGLRFEVGGRMSSKVFSRASLAYCSRGWLQRVTFEDFTSWLAELLFHRWVMSWTAARCKEMAPAPD
jgi:hypothetical protein